MVLYNTALYRKIILIDLDQERLESMSNPIFLVQCWNFILKTGGTEFVRTFSL